MAKFLEIILNREDVIQSKFVLELIFFSTMRRGETECADINNHNLVH